jgi:membrane fusion protein
MPLFRSEALRGQDTLHGEVSLVPPVSWQALGLFLFASVAAATAFMAMAGYAKVTVVKGVVASDRGLARIASSRAGVVGAVYVHEGQAVRAGEPLARIGTAITTEHGPLQARRAEALTAQGDALERRLVTIQQEGAKHLAALSGQIVGDRAQIANLQEQVTQEQALIRIAQADLAQLQPAVRSGFVTNRDLREREDQVAMRQQALARLNQELGAHRAAIGVAESEMARIRADTEGQVSQIGETRAALQREAAGEDLLNAVVLRAPVDGVVTAVTAYAGDPSSPGAALMTLVPRGARVEAALNVPPSAAGLLELNQPVRIAVDAFPYQVYGAQSGTVTAISRATAPGAPGQAEAFLVRATLPAEVWAYGAPHPLRPGMTLTARIRTRPRSLLAWMFDPVLAVGRR